MPRMTKICRLAFLFIYSTVLSLPSSQLSASFSLQERLAFEVRAQQNEGRQLLDEEKLTALVKSTGADKQSYLALCSAVHNGLLSEDQDQAMAHLREKLLNDVVCTVSQQLGVRVGCYTLPAKSDTFTVPINQHLYAFTLDGLGKWQRASELDSEVVRKFNQKWKECHRFLPLSALGVLIEAGNGTLPDPRLQRISVFAFPNQSVALPSQESNCFSYTVIEPDSGRVFLSSEQRALELQGYLTTSASFTPLQRNQAQASAMRAFLLSDQSRQVQELGRLQLDCWRDALALYHLAMVEHLGHHTFWRDYDSFSEDERKLLNEGLLGQLLGVSLASQNERAVFQSTLELSVELQNIPSKELEARATSLFGPLALWLLSDVEAAQIGFVNTEFYDVKKRRAWVDRLRPEQLSRARHQYPILVQQFIERVLSHTTGADALPSPTAPYHEIQNFVERYISTLPAIQNASNREQLIPALRWVGYGCLQPRIISKPLDPHSQDQENALCIHTIDYAPESTHQILLTQRLPPEHIYDLLEGRIEDSTQYSEATWKEFLQFQAKSGTLPEDATPLQITLASLLDASKGTLAQSATICGQSFQPSIEIIDSGPCSHGYTTSSASRSKAQVHLRSSELLTMVPGDRMRIWLQWSPTLEGPWKTRARGEIRVDRSGRVRTRGNVSMDEAHKDELVLHVGPLAHSRWPTGTTPYFRIAQVVKHRGEEWVRSSRRSISPEANNAVFAAPFQAAFGIVFVAKDDSQLKKTSWKQEYLSSAEKDAKPVAWHLFHMGLGGTNHASIVPGQKFFITVGNDHLELWSYHDKPKGFRNQASNTSIPPWGVCPVHIAKPAVGSSTTLTATTQFFGREYTRKFTILGPEPTPRNLEAFRLDQQRYHLVRTPEAPPTGNVSELLQSYKHALNQYNADANDQLATRLAQAYLPLLPLELERLRAQQDPLWHRAPSCATELRAAALAIDLRDWDEARKHLQTSMNELPYLLEQGLLSHSEIAQLLVLPLPVKLREPFGSGTIEVQWLELWKELAYTRHDPDFYEQALQAKQEVGKLPVSPEEYQTLSHLISARKGNRVQAAIIWQKAESLYLDPESPFYNDSMEQKSLLALRPGWWPID